MGRSIVTRQRRWGWRLFGGMGFLALALGACIIEERKYSQQLDNCWEYCERIDQSCRNAAKVYETNESCLATCLLMESGGDVGDTTGNTLSCRLERLRAGIEPQQCAAVGPGGNGTCGSNCRALCSLRSKVCPSEVSIAEPGELSEEERCESQCLGLSEVDGPGVDLSGDSVHCRLAYVARAAVSPEQAALHCPHSQIRPVPGEDPTTAACSDAPGLPKELECQKYCDLVTNACTGQYAVYGSESQCLDTCLRTMEPGEPGDQTLDTIRCRRYHAYFALLEPETHCLHASPTGDGHCGTENCTGYCRILQTACPGEFAAEYADAAACASECSQLGGAKRDEFALPPMGALRYQVNPAPAGNTLMCRAFNAVEALTGAESARPALCAAALGGAPCR